MPRYCECEIKLKYPILDLLIEWTQSRLERDRRATLAEEYCSLCISRICYEADPIWCEIGQVAEVSGLPYPTVARIMAQQVDKGLLHKAVHPEDARRTVYTPPMTRIANHVQIHQWASYWKEKLAQIEMVPDEYQDRKQALIRTHKRLGIETSE